MTAKPGPDLSGVGMSALWERSLRPSLRVTWTGRTATVKEVVYTVSTDGAAPVVSTNPPSSPATFAPGIDPLVGHTVTLRFVSATGQFSEKSFPLTAVPVGPHPKNQEPTLPPNAKLIGGRPNPCAEFRWRYNPDRQLVDPLPALQKAFADLSAINGIRYTYDGTTTESKIITSNHGTSSDGSTRKWMLVQWEDPAHPNADASEHTVGYAGPGQPIGLPGLAPDFSDGADLTFRANPALNDPVALTAAIYHELGHAHGLAHTDDPTSIMQPSNAGVSSYGPNDVALLQALGGPGAGGCTS